MLKLRENRHLTLAGLLIMLLLLLLWSAAPAAGAQVRQPVLVDDSWVSNICSADDLAHAYTEQIAQNNVASFDADSLEQLEEIVRENIYNRNTAFTVHYAGNTNNLTEDVTSTIEKIIDGDDYLAYNMRSWSYSGRGFVGDITLNFSAAYWTTPQQDEYVSSEVRRIISDIIAPDMDDHQKVKAVHDYIVTHVAYDQSLVEHSAYAALQGSVVCQGYALLTYRMLAEAGIMVRIVEGDVNGGAHAWNLVHIYGHWYHLDCMGTLFAFKINTSELVDTFILVTKEL